MAKTVNMTFNASGAAEAGRRGDVVVIVDVIDMSTSAEVALENGAIAIFGASPSLKKAPVNLNPERMGFLAGKTAIKHKTDVVVIGEPRYASDEAERRKRAELALQGLKRAGMEVERIIPNLGSEIGNLVDFNNKVVLIVSDTGGVAFDAAYNSGAPAVLTATITRTATMKGVQPALMGVKRAIESANSFDTNITIVGASANSMEDVLAAEYLVKTIIGQGFLAM